MVDRGTDDEPISYLLSAIYRPAGPGVDEEGVRDRFKK